MGQDISHLVEIMEKIKDVGRLPTYEEVQYFLRAVSENKGGIRSKLGLIYPHDSYSIYTGEFVDELASVIRGLNEHPIIEICAGNGKLSYHLRKRGLEIKATDDYSLKEIERQEELVERATHNEALRRHQPRIVLGSWIPNQTRIGFDVLGFPTVGYFIDIGEDNLAEDRNRHGWRTLDLYMREDLQVTHLASAQKYHCSHWNPDVVLFVKKGNGSGSTTL
ncbi:hypothetical protein HYT53_02045 [Candidatus Woesearchaeota archaeon]|nr:hypothetical protein [Candidatus Woesearchaeota archaeon]